MKYHIEEHRLKDKSVSGFFRILAKAGDNMMKMQIARIDFKE